MKPYEIGIYIWLFVFGACIGSFINVVITRLPEKGAFLSKKRSYCPACGGTLRWRDLIPIASWLILRGRCRDCKAGISPRYPLTEAFCAVLAMLCYLRWGFSRMVPLAFGVAVILLAVAEIDRGTMEIPNSLVLALVPFAAGAVWARPDVTLLERGIGFLAVSLPMLMLTLVISGAFGGGDIKLMAVCGFLLGWKCTLLAFFIAVLFGGSRAVYLLLAKKSKRGAHIAFGPYLCAGTAVSLAYGAEIIEAYLGLYGL